MAGLVELRRRQTRTRRSLFPLEPIPTGLEARVQREDLQMGEDL